MIKLWDFDGVILFEIGTKQAPFLGRGHTVDEIFSAKGSDR